MDSLQTGTDRTGRKVEIAERGISVGGKHEVLLCASLFYFRMPRAVWQDRIRKLKATGYNCVDIYFPWNYHERADGSFDFTGERDVRFFLGELKAAGLYAIVRPGPYICSEWNGGGLPARILESGMPIRCADAAFLKETERWYRAILAEIAPFSCTKGGTVILLQLENELDFFDCPAPVPYIAALRKIAADCCDIPCFCCAGQFDVTRAGGWAAEGVEATLNCYPDSLDPAFDRELAGYAENFLKRGKPLLVSETNRDHFLLRRELSCGAKLLGAYNQVAGVNFDYNQAVNNWGSPDSFIVTVYDFGSMIDPAGAYRPEAEEGALFAAFLKTVGEGVAAALPAKEGILPDHCTFVTAEGGMRVLELAGGGRAVCVANFSEDGSADFSCNGHAVHAEVRGAHAPFLLFDYPLAPYGIPATLVRSNCELIRAEKDELVFYAEGEPSVGLDFGGGEERVNRSGRVHGVQVRFLGRREALALVAGEVTVGTPSKEPFQAFYGADLPVWREVPSAAGTHFGALGLGEGAAAYTVRIPAGEALFVEHPCDMLRVDTDGRRGETLFADGRDMVFPSVSGTFTVTAEKWGHCNFDDPQSPALRTSCKKGVLSFGRVRGDHTAGRCDFALLDTFGEEKIDIETPFPVRLATEKWNSTRKPVICAYSLPVTRRAERLLLKTTEETDVAVYLGGTLLGLCGFGSFELTDYLKKGETATLTVVYRKRVWTQNVGNIRLLDIDPVSPESVRVCGGAEMCRTGGRGEALTLPLKVEGETAFCADLPLGRECFLRFTGKNVKITCIAEGRVVARLILDWAHAPLLTGGDPALVYLCPAWKGPVRFVAEALGGDAEITGAAVITTL